MCTTLQEYMGVEPQDEFEKSLLSIKSEQAKIEKIEDWLKKFEESRTLASLDNVRKVKSIAWVPQASSKGIKPTFDNNTLKGKYVVRYENGPEMKDITVKSDWAERNFSVVALACAQKLAYDQIEKQEGTPHVARDFVDIAA